MIPPKILSLRRLWPAAFFCLLAAFAMAPPRYLYGVNDQGEKVYAGPVPIEPTEPYQALLETSLRDVDIHTYLFRRLRQTRDLRFFHNGSWYGPLETAAAGMWLLKTKYKKGDDLRGFIRDYVDRALDTGQPHLIKYPDGSIHLASSVLYNELDLLDEALQRKNASRKVSPRAA